MTGKLILAAVLSGFGFVGYQFRAAESQGTTAQLHTRVLAYYSTLKNQQFEETWTFLDATARRDNPKEEYAKTLRASQRGVDLVGEPKVSLATKPLGDPRAGGVVVAMLRIKGTDEKTVDVEHTTMWGWGAVPQSTQPNWYIVRETMQDVRKTSSSIAIPR